MLFNVLHHAADFHLLNSYKCLTILSGLLRFYTKKSNAIEILLRVSYAVFSGLIVSSCAFVCSTAGSINQLSLGIFNFFKEHLPHSFSQARTDPLCLKFRKEQKNGISIILS